MVHKSKQPLPPSPRPCSSSRSNSFRIDEWSLGQLENGTSAWSSKRINKMYLCTWTARVHITRWFFDSHYYQTSEPGTSVSFADNHFLLSMGPRIKENSRFSWAASSLPSHNPPPPWACWLHLQALWVWLHAHSSIAWWELLWSKAWSAHSEQLYFVPSPCLVKCVTGVLWRWEALVWLNCSWIYRPCLQCTIAKNLKCRERCKRTL